MLFGTIVLGEIANLNNAVFVLDAQSQPCLDALCWDDVILLALFSPSLLCVVTFVIEFVIHSLMTTFMSLSVHEKLLGKVSRIFFMVSKHLAMPQLDNFWVTPFCNLRYN